MVYNSKHEYTGYRMSNFKTTNTIESKGAD